MALHVTLVTSQEAVSLLWTSVPKDSSSESDTIELGNALNCLTLAIKQASGYIIATNTSIKDYQRPAVADLHFLMGTLGRWGISADLLTDVSVDELES